MKNKHYIPVTTKENSRVLLRKDQIAAIEEIPSTARGEGYLKLYVAGYSFAIKNEGTDLESFVEKLGADE